MVAIKIDEEGYLQSYSRAYRTPGSILLEDIPNETDSEKLHCYKFVEGKFVFDADKWQAIEQKRAESARIDEINAEISRLKEQIAASDYQILKCYEYALNNLELPYDAEALHAKRQELRDKINELEKEL